MVLTLGIQIAFKLGGAAHHCGAVRTGRISEIRNQAQSSCALAGSLERELQENWQRVSLAFPALEGAYFAQREAVLEQHAQQAQQAQQLQRSSQHSGDQPLETLQLDVGKMTEDHISGFSQDLSHFCRHSKLAVGCADCCRGIRACSMQYLIFCMACLSTKCTLTLAP